MNIVILDGFTSNPGDLSWGKLSKLGNLTVYDRTGDEDFFVRARDAEIILTNKVILDAARINALAKLKFVCVLATGCNMIDLEAASQRDIIVSNIPAYSTDSVVQMVFAHLFNLMLHVAEHSQGVKGGKWQVSKDFCYWDFPLVEAAGLTFGIIGFGRTGKAVARAADAFGMKVLVHTRTAPQNPPAYVELAGLEDIFRRGDIVSLHCPLTDKTERIINERTLSMMKRDAFLINTGRGPLVDEGALADALNAGRIAGAGLDVLSTEPPLPENPLLCARNCYITPHIAWAAKASRQRLIEIATANCRAFIESRPQNIVGGQDT